ncbi:MAG TPA: alpha/beta hydrolase [Rhizomicrobium sp.]|jgi:pimeloyl-ACP methyl ester carboxylesterase|nr:alpha/beta hydrolase [Rhizomicrobium sp.]
MPLVTAPPTANDPRRAAMALGDGCLSCIEWQHAGAPTVVFAHANGFNALTYRILFAPLGTSLHVVACDLRGHGFSTLATGADLAKNWTVFRDDMLGAIAQLSSEPVLLAGHSLGATSSLMAAAQAPKRVRSVLLIEPVLIPPLRGGGEQNASDLATRAKRRRNMFPSFEAAFSAYRGRGIFASWPDEVLADYLRGGLIETDGSLRLACAPQWEAAIFRGAPHDTAPLASAVTCPMTIIVGTRNSAASEQQLSVIRKLRPDARILVVEGASHFLPMERPDIVREELLRLAEKA